jgi:hypothetical protein
MGNDPALYFCESPKTKEGPNPIGFLKIDAPACALYASRRNAGAASRTTVIVMRPNDEGKEGSISKIEGVAVRLTVLLATLSALGSWLVSHLSPSLSALIASLLAKMRS